MDAGISEVGGYRLLAEIGRGGFGVVYRARDSDGGLAAVKLLHVGMVEGAVVEDEASDANQGPDAAPAPAPALGPNSSARRTLAREVEAVGKVGQFCVARVLDFDLYAERPWIATEFIEGRTLTREIAEKGPRGGADLQRLAVSTATALTAIHQAGVVHRDFKPDNIMMAQDGPRVIDFGIARFFENTAFSATANVGTARFMAPERLNGSPLLTSAVDMFSWGAVMVYAASGRHAFEGGNQAVVINKILNREPDCSVVPAELRGLVARCLAKDPDLRPSAREVLDTLLGRGTGDTSVEDVPASGRATAVTTATTAPMAGEPLMEGIPSATRVWDPLDLSLPLETTPKAPKAEEPGSRRPYGFAGRWYGSLDELTEAFQTDMDAACEVFGDLDERADLAAWIAADPEEARVTRNVLHRQIEDVELAVLGFIALVRPDLPPRFRGSDAGLAAVRAEARGWMSPLTDAVDLPLAVAEVAAGHDCREPGHPCLPGYGCDEYRRMIRMARSALDRYRDESARYNALLSEVEPEARAEFGRWEAGGLCLRAVLAPDEWRRAVRRRREELDPLLWRHLPPESPVGTPQPVRAGDGLVVHVLVDLISRLGARSVRLVEKKGLLLRFARELKRQNAINTWSGLALVSLGVLLFFLLRDADMWVMIVVLALPGIIFWVAVPGLVNRRFRERWGSEQRMRMLEHYRSALGWRNMIHMVEEDTLQVVDEAARLNKVLCALPITGGPDPR